MNDLILEIMKTALEINSEDKNTVFVHFMGHINELQVSVYKDGWKSEKLADFNEQVSFDTEINSIECAIEKLSYILEYLKRLEGEI